MSEDRIVKCDHCPTKEHHADQEDQIDDGWTVAFDAEGRHDFCTKLCVINYYTGDDFRE